MIKPVLRYPGSKYRQITKIIAILDLQKQDVFIDLFAGSGIVGVNVKHLIGCPVIINDYDKIFPIKTSTAIKNMVSFQGIGKSFTKVALEYFNRRIRNGYWEKLTQYNNILKQCCLISHHFGRALQTLTRHCNGTAICKIYLDPPYTNIKSQLYQNNTIDHFHLKKDLEAFLKRCPQTQFCLSYNDDPTIRKLYQNWHINTLTLRYFTDKTANYRHEPKTQELIITNFLQGTQND